MIEYFREEDGTWWKVDPEYGVPERVLDRNLIDEMDYLQGACPFCGMRHDDGEDC